MKKRIDLIQIQEETLNYLLSLLNESTAHNLELKECLKDLKNGISQGLILELENTKAQSPEHCILQFGELVIYTKARKITINNTEIFLTPKEFDILLFLAQNKGQVFTKEQIYQAVWDNEYLLDESNIMAFIRKLRKKIEPNPDNPEYIITIWGIGYKFNENK